MRNRTLSSILLLATAALASHTAFADDPADGSIVGVNARYVFSPVGFDDNDETEIVVDGFLPSGCYRLTDPKVSVDAVQKKIVIKPMARYFDVPCIEAMVPYFFAAKVGLLGQGDYAIEVAGPETLLTETLPVKHAAGPSPDDYVYAPVDDVRIDTNPTTGRLEATIQGRFTSSCMQWDEARVEDYGKTIVVLPILTLEDGRTCDSEIRNYTKVVQLPVDIARGRHLLHVRSLNGQAFNRLFYKN